MQLSEILNKQIPERPIQLGSSVFIDPSYVGIEIEMEQVGQDQLRGLRSWSTVSEGSVEGYEIVLREPKCLDQLYLALRELDQVRDNIDEARTFTERTSNHVHIDVRDMTVDQFLNFVVLSVMFEAVLYKYVAPHRSGNHFCFAFSDCQNLLRNVQAFSEQARTGDPRRIRESLANQFSASNCKYSGINLSSVSRYGSLEFRMHEGTLDPNAMIRWINILLSLKSYAMGEGRTPSNILETKQDVGIDSIFTAVLSQYRGVLEYQGAEEDILKGIRMAQDFVSCTQERPQESVMEAGIPQDPEPYRSFINSL